MMPGPHYAISEALIVVVAIWSVFRLIKLDFPLTALGVGILGTAAAIGVFRFATGQIELLASFHRNFSQLGGAIAMSLIMAGLVLQLPFFSDDNRRSRLPIFTIAATVLLVLLFPQLATGLFLAWLGAGILFVSLSKNYKIGHRVLMAGVISIFLFNIVLIRQSSLLGPDLSWHIFHVLIAVWLVGLVWVCRQFSDVQRPAPGTG